MPDGRIGLAVEHLAVDPLDVLGARAVLDLEPAAKPLHVRAPGVGEPLVDTLGAPVLVSLLQPGGREEEHWLRPRELGAAPEVLVVGDSDRRVMLELVAEVPVHGAAYLGVSGQVTVEGGFSLRWVSFLVGTAL